MKNSFRFAILFAAISYAASCSNPPAAPSPVSGSTLPSGISGGGSIRPAVDTSGCFNSKLVYFDGDYAYAHFDVVPSCAGRTVYFASFKLPSAYDGINIPYPQTFYQQTVYTLLAGSQTIRVLANVCPGNQADLDWQSAPETLYYDSPFHTDVITGAIRNFSSCMPPPPSQGCSPGYWKTHPGSYPAGTPATTQFSAIFENAFPGLTLLDVLNLNGGGLNALGRTIVSAYLNALTISGYSVSASQVVADFNAVYPGGDYNALKAKYEALQDPCPLN